MSSIRPGESISVWNDTAAMPKYESLNEDLIADVCIIGGGIAGLTSAYLLMKEGEAVCLLEDFELASGQTGRTSAHVSSVLDTRYFEIEKIHGSQGARLAYESHAAALNKIQSIIRAEKIDCDLKKVSGYLFSEEKTTDNTLQMEFEAARRAGVNVIYLEKSPLPFRTGPCLQFPDQLQFHPVKYLNALAKIIVKGGAKIFTNTQVVNIRSGSPAIIFTKSGPHIECRDVIVATNTPINDLVAIHTKQAAYRTYVIGIRVPKGSIETALYWDMAEPFHYLRLGPDISDAHDILLVGGEDHKTGQDHHPEWRFNFLENWLRDRIPFATEIVYKWSGQIMESTDGLAFLGRNPLDEENVFIITGDSGNGITATTVGAMLITDQIMDRKNQWVELYNPGRFTLNATSKYLQENVNVVAQYADWFHSGAKPDFKNIPPEQGVVFRSGLRMIAAFKNANGNVELMSATCPHLAGVVAWNSVEKSWDCPCHGSRFNCHGKVIEGPAHKDLKKISEAESELNLMSIEQT